MAMLNYMLQSISNVADKGAAAMMAGPVKGLRDNPVLNYAIAIFIIAAIIYLAVLQYLVLHVAESDFQFHITAGNVILGISISVFVGILAGFIPAWFAANMKPVDAIRS